MTEATANAFGWDFWEHSREQLLKELVQND
jgi:hypothetical protein